MPIDQELIRQLFDFSFIHFQSAAALGISFYLIRTCLRILLPFYQILREAVQTWPFITFASTIYTFFESWSNFIAQYTRVHEGTQYTLSSSSTLIIFLWVQSVQQHHRNKFLKLFFAFCLPICGGSVVTSSHTFACFCVEPQKTELTVWQCGLCPACWTCMVLFVLEDVLLSDDSSMIFILHLRRFTFLGHHQKSDRTFLPPMQWTLGHFCCSSASLGSRGTKSAPCVWSWSVGLRKKTSRNDPQALKAFVSRT